MGGGPKKRTPKCQPGMPVRSLLVWLSSIKRGFLVEQVSGHHLLYYTRLYRIRGSWGSFLTQLDIDFSTQPTMQSSRVVLVLLAWKLKVWE